jgi:transposase
MYKDKEFLIQKYNIEGLSCKDIGLLCGVSNTTVYLWLKKHNITCRAPNELNTKNNSFITLELLVELYIAQNLTTLMIAKKLDRSKPLILSYMKKFNIPRREMSVAKIGRKLNVSQEWRDSRSKKYSGKGNTMYGKRGKDHPAWISPEIRKTCLYDQIRGTQENRKWRKQVLDRDNNSCVVCGSKEHLNADHIKSFAETIKENKITEKQQAVDCMELWDINNGRTLCESCHKKTPSYGKRIK